MSEWKMKRFWTAAEVHETPDGFSVLLDGRNIKSPAKTSLVVPTHRLATMIAEEWQAQGEEVDPRGMPMTRLANSALDKVAPQHEAVAAHIAEYGGSDLLCYRAEGPSELVARQTDAWDPLLDWACQALGSGFVVQTGLMPVTQPEKTVRSIVDATRAMSSFALAGFHDLVTLSGSWVLGYATARGRLDPEQAWSASRVDEIWQIEQWGEDDEATELAASKKQELLSAFDFYSSVVDNPA